MAKKKSRPVLPGTSAVSQAEAYEEATYFARKCGLTRDEALRMMRVDMVGAFDPSLFPIFERLVPTFHGFVVAAGSRPEVKQAAA